MKYAFPFLLTLLVSAAAVSQVKPPVPLPPAAPVALKPWDKLSDVPVDGWFRGWQGVPQTYRLGQTWVQASGFDSETGIVWIPGAGGFTPAEMFDLLEWTDRPIENPVVHRCGK